MAIFLTLRLKSFKNLASRYFRNYPFRFLSIVFFSFTAIFGVYLVILEGFTFLVSLGGFGSIIIKRLFYILFFIIFFMLGISFGVLFYTASFRSRETEFLLTLPIEIRKISFFKFIESTLLASWIPILGLIVFIASYAKINHIPIFLPLLSFVYFIPFILISCFLGYLVCVSVLKFFNLKKLFIFVILVFIATFLLFTKSFKKETKDIFYLLSEEIIFFKISKTWFLPFSWVPWGIIHFEDGNLLRSFVFLANLWSLSLLCLNSLFLKGGNIFTNIFIRHSIPKHKYYHKSLLDKLLRMKLLPHHFRNFFLKDIKLFIREPILWLQFLIFFGLLFFYFLNLRRFSYHLLDDLWKNLIVFLNTFSVLCIVGALAIRFVFPQWSLEGKSYWILKLSPIALKSIYLEKFILSFLIMFLTSLVLIFTSNQMLKASMPIFYLTFYIELIASFSLVSFSLGLGAYFADFKTDYYLKAVESLGGLVALVLNFSYVVITVFIFTFINHLFIIGKLINFKKYLLTTIYLWTGISFFLVYILTYVGLRKLKEKEY